MRLDVLAILRRGRGASAAAGALDAVTSNREALLTAACGQAQANAAARTPSSARAAR